MKNLLTALFVLGAMLNSYGQFKIQAGATVTLNGSATLVLQDSDLINEGTLNTGTSTISFTGTTSNTLEAGGAALYNLEVNKSSGADLNVTQATSISNQLSFAGDNNKVNLSGADLTLGSATTINGADNTDFIVTAGAGQVIKESLTAFTYPVGFSGSTYNPLTITDAGTADNIGVRVLENAYDDGTSTGAQLTSEVVDATWVLTEATAGGSDLTVTAEWAATDEQGDFDRTKSGIARYDGIAYDLTLANTAAAAGTDPYTRTRSGLQPGSLVVGGGAVMDEVLVAPTVLLSGPFNGTDMNDDLRSEGVLPTAEPYGGLGYTHTGLGGGESVANVGDFDQPGTDGDIVDWIFLELRDKTNNQTILGTQSALLRRDGNIVGTDFMDVSFKGFSADDYFITIRHRNHLAIQSLNAVALNKTAAAAIDFSDNSTSTFGTNAQRTDGALFYMWSGNGNANTSVVYSGSGSDITPITATVFSDPANTLFESSFPAVGYHLSDYNLSGETVYSGSGSDITPLTLSVFSNPANTLFESSFPVAEQLPEN